ncbi:MAG TPA: signal peptidase I [Terriglobia bacterium]|nr:signal peptidase I [Terriglobia bacterium]
MRKRFWSFEKVQQETDPSENGVVPDNLENDTEQSRRKSAAREWLESLVFSLIFVFFFTSFIAQATQVPTESMKPTILVGDHFFLDKFAFPANYPDFMSRILPVRSVKRGDIVAFKSPENPKVPFIKRVIGVPGDILEIRDKVVYINGRKLDEPYKYLIDPNIYERGSGIPQDYLVRDNYGPVRIPPYCYFMMGDNRDNSNDSRYWGFVKAQYIIGKPLFIYWSYEADPYDPRPKSVIEYAKEYGSVALNFFTRTRWSRTGKILR